MSDSTNSESRDSTRSPETIPAASIFRRNRIRMAVLAIVFGMAAFAAWSLMPTATVDPIPDVSLDGVDAAVSAAIITAQRVVEREPSSGANWGQLGMVLKAHEYEAQATGCFRVALRLDTAEFRWPYLLGVSLQTVDRAAALVAFDEAIARAPKRSLPRLRKAELLLDLDRAAEAAHELEFVLSQGAGDGRAEYRMTQLHFEAGRFDDSFAWAKRALKRAPKHRGVHELMSQVYGRLKKWDEAEREATFVRNHDELQTGWPDRYLEDVVQLRRDKHWQAFRAKQLIENGQPADGIQLLGQLVREHPAEEQFRTQLVRALIARNQLESAAAILDAAPADAALRSFDIQRLHGAIELMQRDLKSAESHFRAAIALKADNAAVHFDLAYCLVQLGKSDEALHEFRQAVRYQVDHIEARLEVSRLLLDAGRVEDAVTELRFVLKISPEHPAASALFESLNLQP